MCLVDVEGPLDARKTTASIQGDTRVKKVFLEDLAGVVDLVFVVVNIDAVVGKTQFLVVGTKRIVRNEGVVFGRKPHLHLEIGKYMHNSNNVHDATNNGVDIGFCNIGSDFHEKLGERPADLGERPADLGFAVGQVDLDERLVLTKKAFHFHDLNIFLHHGIQREHEHPKQFVNGVRGRNELEF